VSNALTIKPESSMMEWSQEEIQLIKETVAKGATDSEFKVFLYRCRKMDLDPLKSGQIFFIKYNNNPGTIVVGLDGFRARAARTGLHSGTKRGVIRDDKGKCIGAWAEVYRKDWEHPAREEVSLAEYNSGKAQWAKMPETMIKKVAETAALRMAFPDELGDLRSPEEMDQAEPHAPLQSGINKPRTTLQKTIKEAEPEVPVAEFSEVPADKFPWEGNPEGPALFLKSGKYKGTRLSDKPDEFWARYKHEVQAALANPDFPENLRAEAIAIVELLEEYLAR
jgi:phage recombination protein Bet